MQTEHKHDMLLRAKLSTEEPCNTEDRPARRSVPTRIAVVMAYLEVTSRCKNSTAALILEHFS
jgi:hypothetical protein